MNIENFKGALAPYISDRKDIFFHYKGRVSLFAILKSMHVAEGDEVIIPAFTCVVVANSIKYLGAKPIYVDICSDTYNMDISQLEDKMSSRTKVIICQNTFGLSSNLEEIKKIASQHNLYTIEDCTHGFGGTYNGIPNGLSCDAAFYSMQWNKPFSSGIGGFAIVNNMELKAAMAEFEQELIPVPAKNKLLLKAQYLTHRYLLNKYTYWSLVSLYRLLSKLNIVVGSSSGEEISGTSMPEDFFMAYSETQAKEGARNIKKLDHALSLRKKNARVYTDFLKVNNKVSVNDGLFANHSFLKYPILVERRTEFMKKAMDAKIELGEWFLSPIHPIEEHFEVWDLDINNFPVAQYTSERMLNLPSDVKDTKKVLDFLTKNIDFLV